MGIRVLSCRKSTMVKICILFIVAVFVCTTASCAWASTKAQNPSQASAVSGIWKKSHGKWWYAYNSKTITVQKKSYPANEWVSIGGKKYHFNSAGYMHAGWQKLNNQWYYFGSDGAMKTGWKKIKGNWYYLGADGKMRTGSYTVGKARYYSNSSGIMKTGWQKLNGKWYYFAKSGAMQTSKWISGKYWVGSNGVMATNAWVDNGRYYVGSNGKWVKSSSSSGSNANSISETLARNAIVKNWSNASSMKPSTDFSHVVSIKNDGTFTYSKKYLKYPYSTTSVSGTWKYNGMSSGNYQYLLYRSGKLYGKARIENNGLVWIPNNATSGLYLKSGF